METWYCLFCFTISKQKIWWGITYGSLKLHGLGHSQSWKSSLQSKQTKFNFKWPLIKIQTSLSCQICDHSSLKCTSVLFFICRSLLLLVILAKINIYIFCTFTTKKILIAIFSVKLSNQMTVLRLCFNSDQWKHSAVDFWPITFHLILHCKFHTSGLPELIPRQGTSLRVQVLSHTLTHATAYFHQLAFPNGKWFAVLITCLPCKIISFFLNWYMTQLSPLLWNSFGSITKKIIPAIFSG